MPYELDVKCFVNFYDHNPSTDKRCIFFTKKGPRCRWFCRDNHRAIEIFQRINATDPEDVVVQDILNYILCNCCREGNAKHRDRIANADLLLPLVDRWFDEIQAKGRRAKVRAEAIQLSSSSSSVSGSWSSTPALSSFSTPGNIGSVYTPLTSPSSHHSNDQSSSSSSPTRPEVISSPIPASRSDTLNPAVDHGKPELQTTQSHYNLRSRQLLEERYSLRYLSEFQSHIEEITPRDSVLWKICEPLRKRDSETGSVYIFDRDSSPGHVKIGWTANSVDERLKRWSKCGYTPNKLFSVDDIPNAQRVEVLAHYELVKEWRRERKCKAAHCGISHQEWFEVSTERAIQVVSDWADFFKKARPYNFNGTFEARWRKVIHDMDSNGKSITSKALKEHYEASKREKEATANDKPSAESATSTVEQGPDKILKTSFENCFHRLLSARATGDIPPEPTVNIQDDNKSQLMTLQKVSGPRSGSASQKPQGVVILEPSREVESAILSSTELIAKVCSSETKPFAEMQNGQQNSTAAPQPLLTFDLDHDNEISRSTRPEPENPLDEISSAATFISVKTEEHVSSSLLVTKSSIVDIGPCLQTVDATLPANEGPASNSPLLKDISLMSEVPPEDIPLPPSPVILATDVDGSSGAPIHGAIDTSVAPSSLNITQ